MDRPCQRCKGSGMLEADLINHGTKSYVRSIFGCDDCMGEGYYNEANTYPGRVYCSVTYRNEQPYGPRRSPRAPARPQVQQPLHRLAG